MDTSRYMHDGHEKFTFRNWEIKNQVYRSRYDYLKKQP